MNRDMVWHELYNAINEDECPVCMLLQKIINKFINAFLYESVNDPCLREQLKTSKGLCKSHTWLLQSYGDPLSHAIIYESLLNDTVEGMSKKIIVTGKKKRMNLLAHLEPTGKCLLCEMERKYENIYLKLLDGVISKDTDFYKKFSEKGLLCVPHLKRFIYLSTMDESLTIIQEICIEKYRKLIRHLSEIRRKNDYRYTNEPWILEEREALGKSARILVGRKMY